MGREQLDCKSMLDYNHKWPRGLRKQLIDLDGGKARCWWCWSQQPGLHIAHISRKQLFRGDSKAYWANHAYTDENKHSPKFLVLLCPSCHAKRDKAYSLNSPWMEAFTAAFEERFKSFVETEV